MLLASSLSEDSREPMSDETIACIYDIYDAPVPGWRKPSISDRERVVPCPLHDDRKQSLRIKVVAR